MKLSALVFFIAFSLQTFAQDKPAYKIFTGEGKKADYGDIVKSAGRADVVFFGELHDNPIAHWLELEVTKSLFEEKGKDLILGAEMFEADNQIVINEYFAGTIKESSFESEVRKWNNYATDYKPLVNFAKKEGLKFVASNVPRRYASVVSGGGFEALEKVSADGLKFIAPLPIEYDKELACYKDMLTMGGGSMPHVSENLPKAQALKDATMAKLISDNWQPGKILIHYNGSYHSARYMGIIWYLNKYNPAIKVVTLETVLQDDIEKMSDEHKGSADYIIVIPTAMTRTYK